MNKNDLQKHIEKAKINFYNILAILLATLLLVFFLVFSFKSEKIEQEKTIQWMDSSLDTELAYPS